MDNILSILIFFPLIAGLLGFFVKSDNARIYGITVTAIEFLLSLVLWINYDYSNPGMQFVEKITVIPYLGLATIWV